MEKKAGSLFALTGVGIILKDLSNKIYLRIITDNHCITRSIDPDRENDAFFGSCAVIIKRVILLYMLKFMDKAESKICSSRYQAMLKKTIQPDARKAISANKPSGLQMQDLTAKRI